MEVRASLGAKRLELRTADLRKTESLLSEEAGPDKEIIDVQRFGDRLDLVVRDPEKDGQMVYEKVRSAGVSVDEIRVDDATLENTFVAKLRALGQKAEAVEFPARHDHSNLHGQVAIGAKDLVKTFGAFTAIKNASLQIRNGEVFRLLAPHCTAKPPTLTKLLTLV